MGNDAPSIDEEITSSDIASFIVQLLQTSTTTKTSRGRRSAMADGCLEVCCTITLIGGIFTTSTSLTTPTPCEVGSMNHALPQRRLALIATT
jgi:hypothetical protein